MMFFARECSWYHQISFALRFVMGAFGYELCAFFGSITNGAKLSSERIMNVWDVSILSKNVHLFTSHKIMKHRPAVVLK